MKVTVAKHDIPGSQDIGDHNRIVCELNGATVSVRQSSDGTCMIVALDGKVSMEPRAAAIWIVVKP